jgi:hypothetical protein
MRRLTGHFRAVDRFHICESETAFLVSREKLMHNRRAWIIQKDPPYIADPESERASNSHSDGPLINVSTK